jgi:hypothetical protein
MEKSVFTRVCLSDVRVIMVIMLVPMVERLCEVVMGWILALKCLLLGRVGAYDHVPSCQEFNAAVSRGPGSSDPSQY